MTDIADGGNGPSGLYADGILLDRLIESGLVPTSIDQGSKWWASNPRDRNDPAKDAVEVTLKIPKLVNYVEFEVGNVPCSVEAQYLNAQDQWVPFFFAAAPTQSAQGFVGQPVGLNDPTNPMFWIKQRWKVVPVEAQRIRFLLQRRLFKAIPQGTRNVLSALKTPSAYPVYMRNIQVGYRINSEDDFPFRVIDDTNAVLASATDFLGSQVEFSLYAQRAEKAVDGSGSTFWRCEPQPINYAVVNLYLDVRDDNGDGVPIDRFYMDPVTVGVNCNLYYTSDEPTGDFRGIREPIPDAFLDTLGAPEVHRYGPNDIADLLGFTLGRDAQVTVQNAYLKQDFSSDWWVGFDLDLDYDTSDIVTVHPLVDFNVGPDTPLRLTLVGQKVVFTDQVSGNTAEVTIPSATRGSNLRIVAFYTPPDPFTINGTITVAVSIPGNDPETAANAATPIESIDAIMFGGFSGNESLIWLRGATLKAETLTDETLADFLAVGEVYAREPDNTHQDHFYTVNSKVRIHPSFVTNENAFGIVGGPGDLFERMFWTPIHRDYVLRKGFMHVPVTKARYWKFEFTGLVASLYENFLPIQRQVTLYPRSLVKNYLDVLKTSSTVPPAAQANSNLDSLGIYASALDTLDSIARLSTPAEATQAYYVTDPLLAARAAKLGWVWRYQPWHGGVFHPRFDKISQHVYEHIPLTHDTKVAYFVAIKEVTPYRTDYTFEDDVEEYVEHFLDDAWVGASTDGLIFFPGGIKAITGGSSVTSKVMPSFKKIRGIQFATQETDSTEVLADPDFRDPILSDHWDAYGDASVVREGIRSVKVSRGWVQMTYGSIEAQYGTYENMEGHKYGELEGGFATTGNPEGGLVSEPAVLSGSGAAVAITTVTAVGALGGPVKFEILSEQDGSILANTEVNLGYDESRTLKLPYNVEPTLNRYTYGDLEDFLAVKAAETSGLHFISRPDDAPIEVNDGSDSTEFIALAADPDNSYGRLNISTGDPGFPPDPSMITAAVLHVRYESPVDFTMEAKDDTGASLRSPEPNFAGPGIHETGMGLTLGSITAGTTLWIELNIAVVAPIDRESVAIVDWWIEWVSGATSPTTYGDLEAFRYAELESSQSDGSAAIVLRVRQVGGTRDTFRINRISLFEQTIRWSFSNDGGDTFWPAIGIKDDPFGVLIFPHTDIGDKLPGSDLLWKAEFFRAGASVSSLYVRPWYGTRTTTALPYHDLESLGPNKSVVDVFPETALHPMWRDRSLYLEPEQIEVDTPPIDTPLSILRAPGAYLSIIGDEGPPPPPPPPPTVVYDPVTIGDATDYTAYESGGHRTSNPTYVPNGSALTDGNPATYIAYEIASITTDTPLPGDGYNEPEDVTTSPLTIPVIHDAALATGVILHLTIARDPATDVAIGIGNPLATAIISMDGALTSLGSLDLTEDRDTLFAMTTGMDGEVLNYAIRVNNDSPYPGWFNFTPWANVAEFVQFMLDAGTVELLLSQIASDTNTHTIGVSPVSITRILAASMEIEYTLP